MMVKYLKAKLHGLTVTSKNLRYTGSIKLDPAFIERAGIAPYEAVLVVNTANGERFETYVIEGRRGSREVGLQGGTARLGEVGDELIVMSFVYCDPKEFRTPVTCMYRDNRLWRVVRTNGTQRAERRMKGRKK
jgi:aspartate 1-decarboxylase